MASHACAIGARVNTIVSPPGAFFSNAEIEQVLLADWYYYNNTTHTTTIYLE